MATRQPTSVRVHNPVTPALLSRGVLEVDSIEWKGTEYRFRPPLRLKRSREHGHIVFENAGLELFAYGKSGKEALDALARDFVSLWSIIVEAEDSKLHPSARLTKKRLLKAVSDIWQKQ